MNVAFAQPAALWLLLLIPLLVGIRFLGTSHARKSLTRIASPRLLDQLVSWHARRRSAAAFACELLGIALMIVALARPQWGFTEVESGGSGRSLIIAIDTSKSMLANDLQPDRLTRAKLAAADLVRKLRGDRIGLMPFAGSAFMYAPITPDTDALIESIDSMDAEIIPRGGSNIARAIDKAIETFTKSDLSGQQVVILFSDGEELEGEALAAARRARDASVSLICVAVGTQTGGVIPDPSAEGGYYRDRDGKIVFSRLQRDTLMKIATLTGGLYLPLESKGVSDARIDLILQKLQRSAMNAKTTKKAIDRFQWPLAAGLFSLVTAYLLGIASRLRPGTASIPAAAAAGALLIAMPPQPSLAQSTPISTPISTPAASAAREPIVGDPWKFYREGDFANAQFNFERLLEPSGARTATDSSRASRGLGVLADRFFGSNRAAATTPERLQFARGTAATKAGDFEAAMDAFGAVLATDDPKLRGDAHYNLASTIFEQARTQDKRVKKPTLKYIDGLIRRLENSLEHFQECLVLNNENAAARKNHDAVAELIRKLKEQREQMAQQQGQGQGQGKKQGKQQGKGEGKGQGQGQGEGQPGGKGSQGSENNGGKQEGEDEGEGNEEEGEGNGGEKEEGEEGSGGEKEGEAEKGREKSNEERDGNIGTQPGGNQPQQESSGEAGDGESEPSEDDAVNEATGYSRSEALEQLRQLSDEDTKVRPRMETGREGRATKDW